MLWLTLATVFSFSSAYGELEKNEKNWAHEDPFRMIVSWYLRHAYSVRVQVVHRSDSDAMHRNFAELIQVIYEHSDSAVVVGHHFIEPKELRKSRERHGASLSSRTSQVLQRSLSRAANSGLRSDWAPNALGGAVSILLVPDEAALHEFSETITPWSRRKLKSSLIVVTPTSTSNKLCRNVSGTEAWRHPVQGMLKRIWTEDKVLNRFLSFPTLPCIKESLFAWNPFLKDENGVPGMLKRLEIAADDPTVREALSEFLITVKNMNGYPFRATIFKRAITAFPKSGEHLVLDIDQIAGLDGIVLKTITTWMNCTVELFPPSDDITYGYRTKNGTYVGMIGDVVHRRVDFAANGVFLKDYQTETATEFTSSISSDSICVVVPRAGLIPQWLQIFQCFSPLVWSLLFASITWVFLLQYMMCRLIRSRRTPPSLLIMAIEITLMFTNSPQIMPKVDSERILVGFYLMFGIIIIGTFQGTLYENFTNPRHFRDLSSLAELDESGLWIGISSPNMLTVFGQDEDQELQTLKNLRQKLILLGEREGWLAMDRTAWDKDLAAIERRTDLVLSMRTEYLDVHGEQVLHMIDECPRTYQLTYMVPSGAFYLDRVNLLLRRMVECGLTKHWYDSTLELLITKSSLARAKTIQARDRATPFNLNNTQTSFFVLAGGLLLSLLVFIWENIKFRYKIEIQTPVAIGARRNSG